MPKHQDPRWRTRIGREHAQLCRRGVRYGKATQYLMEREGVSAVAVLLAVGVTQG